MNNIMKLADAYASETANAREGYPECYRKDARAALQAAVTALENDAKRYRWLREHNGDGVVEVSMSDTDSMAAWIYRTDDLGAAVDRAMEAK